MSAFWTKADSPLPARALTDWKTTMWRTYG